MRPDCVGTESRFHDDGFKTLAKSRECNKALTSLNLYQNKFDFDGVKEIPQDGGKQYNTSRFARR